MCTVKAILILDGDGQRLVCKYYDDHFASVKEQRAFEKTLFAKTCKANAEIIMIDTLTILYRSHVDLYFYVVGDSTENEVMLASVLNCLYDSISQILRKSVEKKYLLESLDLAFLALDEICDDGILLETDASQIAHRVSRKESDASSTEQTVMNVVKSARDQLKWSPPPPPHRHQQRVGSVSAAAAASGCNNIRNSGHNNVALSLSPAHKRKLSPTSSNSSVRDEKKSASGLANSSSNNNEAGNSSKCLKFKLDDDLVQQLFDSDSQPHDESSSAAASGKTHLVDVSNANKAMPVKAEPVDLSETSETKPSTMSEEERETLDKSSCSLSSRSRRPQAPRSPTNSTCQPKQQQQQQQQQQRRASKSPSPSRHRA